MSADAVLRAVAEGGLLSPARPVVVLLSGGRDSVCLLDLAVRVCGTGAVRVLHVDYGLRGSESTADAALCEELCDRLGVELSVRRLGGADAGSGPPRRAGNLQAWARQERYGAALALASGADVAAGHTASDQVETIVYRLASSPSRRALLGMRPREGPLVRPLLGIWREETGAYCRERGLPWREDASNEDQRFARSRVRANLVPALRTVHPAAEENVLSVAETLRDEAEVLDGVVDGVLAGRSTVELDELAALAPALARLVVQRLADEAAGGPAPGIARRLADILALRRTGSAALHLPGGIRVSAVRGTLTFSHVSSDGGHARSSEGERPGREAPP